MNNSVCYKCSLRHTGCHADCPDGIAEEKRNAEDRAKRRQENIIRQANIESVRQCASEKYPRLFPKYIKSLQKVRA